MMTLMYTTVKCSLQSFCKNDCLKYKINYVVLNANKVVFEEYILANQHLLKLEKPIPRLREKFFQNILQWVSKHELICTYVDDYKDLWLVSF